MNHDAEQIFEEGYRAFQVGRFPEARRLFERALELSPTDPDMLRVYAHVLLKLRSIGDAIRSMEDAVKNATGFPSEAQILADAAGLFLYVGHKDRAREILRTADSRNLRHRHFEKLKREIELSSKEEDDLGSDSPYDQIS